MSIKLEKKKKWKFGPQFMYKILVTMGDENF